MVFSPRDHGDGDSLSHSSIELSLNQLSGPDSGRINTLPDALTPSNQHVRADSSQWCDKDSAPRRFPASSLTPRTRSQPSRYQSTSQLAHLKSESRRASQRLAEAAAASTSHSNFTTGNQVEEDDAAPLYGSMANTASPSLDSPASPPRRDRQSLSSRRSTAGSDLSTIPPLSAENWTSLSLGLSLAGGPTASFSSSTYSPIGSMEFLSRDVEEEERALRSKSDKERAFLYKLRYTDLYDETVALAKRVMLLEEIRANKNEELYFLRSKVATQSSIIETMNDSVSTVEPADHLQEKKMQALCREVAALVRQLKERDSEIHRLQSDKDEEMTGKLDALDLAHLDSKASSAMDSSTVSVSDYTELEMSLEMAERGKKDAESKAALLAKQLAELERRYRASEAQRTALEDGLEGAEQQLTAIQTQWEQEKRELEEAGVRDDRKTLAMAAESDRLKAEAEALKQALAVSEKRSRTILDANRRAVADNQAVVARLEAEVAELKAVLEESRERDSKTRELELEAMETRQKLERAEFRVRSLEKELDAREADLELASRQHQHRLRQLETRMFQAEIVRRSLHNQVMELKGNIRVFCRVRPVLRHEGGLIGGDKVFAFPDYKTERRQIELHASSKAHTGYGQNSTRDSIKKYNFDFDMVFDGGCSQEEFFLEVAALIQSALDGYNVCIFAYGQTGSGKTYTMQGLEEEMVGDSVDESPHMGIVGRAIAHIFASMDDLRSSGWDFSASLEMVEIYNETLNDLLATSPSSARVDLRLDADGKPVAMNSVSHTVTTEREAWSLLQQAMTRRSTKATSMNDRSSRSHCVIAFRLNGVNALTGDRRVGVVNLVDLAGSERLSRSGSDQDPELMKEAMAINKSLSSLGSVIGALSKKAPHVPFRDSKLTHLLSPSLGGDCKTLMICNLSPLGQHRDETLNSLRFAKTVNSCEIAFPSISSRSQQRRE